MKKTALIAALAFTSSAFAGIHLTVRSDYVNTSDYTNNLNTKVEGTSLFTPSFARLYMNGKVGDADVKSGLDIRSYATQVSGTTYYSDMTVDKLVHFLYLDKPLVDNLRFTAGKLEINQGGWEWDQIEAGDSYMDSLANGGTGPMTTTTAATVVAAPGNGSGAGLSYSFMDTNSLTFQVANQTNQASGNTTTAVSSNKRHTMGLSYTGWFMNKSLGVKAGWLQGAADVTDPTATNTGVHSGTQYINAGVKYSMSNLVATLDYLANSQKNTTGAGVDTKNNTTSWVLSANYTIDTYRPLLKYEMSENKASNDTNNANSFKRNAFTVGVEFLTQDNFRWHVAYTNVKDDYGLSTNNDPSQSQYIAGLKWDTDLLK